MSIYEFPKVSKMNEEEDSKKLKRAEGILQVERRERMRAELQEAVNNLFKEGETRKDIEEKVSETLDELENKRSIN